MKADPKEKPGIPQPEIPIQEPQPEITPLPERKDEPPLPVPELPIVPPETFPKPE